MSGPYPRGVNPYGGSFAAEGALWKAGIQAGFEGTVMGFVAKGADDKYYAPIGESHCIAFYRGGMVDGQSVNLAAWIMTQMGFFLQYGSPPGMPEADVLVPMNRVKLVNGVYQVQSLPGATPGTSTGANPAIVAPRLSLRLQ